MMRRRALPEKNDACRLNVVFWGAVLILGLAGLAAWLWLDQRVISYLARTRGDWSVGPAADVFSRVGKAWLQVWLLLVWFHIARRRQAVQAGLLALVIVGAVATPLKYAVARPRPYVVLRAQESGQIDGNHTHHLSFPSGDTAATFAVTTAILPALAWPVRLPFLGVCAAIGCLRVGVAAHYPSDVLAGAAIGLLAGWLAIRLVAAWGRSDRPVPFESWLAPLGIVAIPAAVGIVEGPAELMLVLKTYGVLVLCLLLGARIWQATRGAPAQEQDMLTEA
jgi:membrane-associated phospholipid phosphatase